VTLDVVQRRAIIARPGTAAFTAPARCRTATYWSVIKDLTLLNINYC